MTGIELSWSRGSRKKQVQSGDASRRLWEILTPRYAKQGKRKQRMLASVAGTGDEAIRGDLATDLTGELARRRVDHGSGRSSVVTVRLVLSNGVDVYLVKKKTKAGKRNNAELVK